jgi:hypothetical protein
MYRFHVWLVLRGRRDEDRYDGIASSHAQIRERWSDVGAVPSDPLHWVNGEAILQCSGSRNHRGDTHQQLEAVLTWTIRELPATHGLVYWCDDEDAEAYVYRVLVVARGTVEERSDPFLSPIVPTVEDP